MTNTCTNCGHLDHHGARCSGSDDANESCVCSWPDPGNFTTPAPVPASWLSDENFYA